MFGQPSVTARRWLSRCLLSLLALAALGLRYADHCADHSARPAGAALVAAPLTATHPEASAIFAGAEPAGLEDPGTTAGACHVVTSPGVVAATPTAVAVTPPAATSGPRTIDTAARPAVQAIRRCPALTEIGISRT